MDEYNYGIEDMDETYGSDLGFDESPEGYVDAEVMKDTFNHLFYKPLNPKPIIHKCKDGKLVCLNYNNPYNKDIPKMTDSHLLNTLKYIKRRIKEGVVEKLGGGYSSEPDSLWYDEHILTEKEAKKKLNYKVYKKEAKSRGLI